MNAICITDLHGSETALERILADAGPVDLVLLGGDITSFGTPEDCEMLVRRTKANGATVAAVAGNCDSADIDRRLIDMEVSLSGRGLVVGQIGLQGLPAMPPWHSTMYSFTEEELAEMLDRGAARIRGAARRVVLSHAPPRGTLDRTRFFQHVGSTALRAFIDREQPDLVVCGHIHEGRGIDTIGRTIVANCGAAFAGHYGRIEFGPEIAVDLRRA